MGSAFALPPTIQKEEFSRAYVAAIAAVAGFSAERRQVDQDCIDIDIRQRGGDDAVPLGDCLCVQAKCTSSHSPDNGCLRYPVDIRTYNSLRQRRWTPRILVVVHIPRDVDEWLTQDVDSIILRYCAYWLSVCGMGPTENADSITVSIPIVQRFTVEWLQQAMDTIALGGQL